jgi:hypothetical protein
MSKKVEENPKQAKSNYPEQERESLRLGHEAATKESVVDAKEEKSCHQAAKNDRFEKTGEPNAAPRVDEVGQE